jgi:hypothetical protein
MLHIDVDQIVRTTAAIIATAYATGASYPVDIEPWESEYGPPFPRRLRMIAYDDLQRDQ